jgi:hypothetical protein
MACSTSVKIYVNFGSREVFVLRVQTGLNNSVSDLEKFPDFCLSKYLSLKCHIFSNPRNYIVHVNQLVLQVL